MNDDPSSGLTPDSPTMPSSEQPSHAAKLTTDQLQDVAAVLAHELRNPLSVFRTAVDLLPTDTEANANIQAILRRQVEHMTHLVDDLLDMSRSVKGKTRLLRKPVELQPIIEDAIQNLKSTLAVRRQTVATEMPEQTVWLNADRFRIFQIMLNLLSNASKYSESNDEIQVAVKADGATAEIRIRDHGMGIDARDLPILFDYFSQTPHALDRAQGGLGIGLGLVRGLVEMHGGTVTAFSFGKGTGSEFILRLPQCDGDLQLQLETVAVEPTTPCRVLVVDDRRDNEFLLRALVKKVGAQEIRSAYDGPSALEILTQWVPDIILLDLGLPGMNGLELAREVRNRDACRECLIVALTGYDNDDMRRKASESGIDLYRLKPASITMLRELFGHPVLARKSNLSPGASASPNPSASLEASANACQQE